MPRALCCGRSHLDNSRDDGFDIGAVPFGFALNAPNLAPLPVQYHCNGQTKDTRLAGDGTFAIL